MSSRIPEICDYDCPYADFPPAQTAGICRTMSAVWCKQLGELVNKNLPCEWRKRGGDSVPSRQKRSAMRKRGPRAAKTRRIGKPAARPAPGTKSGGRRSAGRRPR